MECAAGVCFSLACLVERLVHQGNQPARKTWCDQTHEGGGWTLVARGNGGERSCWITSGDWLVLLLPWRPRKPQPCITLLVTAGSTRLVSPLLFKGLPVSVAAVFSLRVVASVQCPPHTRMVPKTCCVGVSLTSLCHRVPRTLSSLPSHVTVL